MTRDEQKAITEFVQRAVSGCQPAMDVEADAIIRALFVRNPDAAYRITRLAMMLDQAQMVPGNEARATPVGRLLAGVIRRLRRTAAV